MTSVNYTLYWEDVAERVIYAELDDYAWKFPEQFFKYKKQHSIYIYHHGRLAAYYSERDSQKEAMAGRKYYTRLGNAAKVIRLKKRVFTKVNRHEHSLKELKFSKISDKRLQKLIITTLDLYREALSMHYLTQPQFFEGFTEGDATKYRRILDKLADHRLRYTRKAWTKTFRLARRLLKEYARRKKMSRQQVESLKYTELASGRLDRRELKQREKSFVLVSSFHKPRLYTGKSAQNYITKYERYQGVNFVKGTTGNKGKKMGRAFVVSTENLDLLKLPKGMRKGMILIVQNAWPEFEKYYGLASAIVTNEGGITSHGVVVSRELGIPSVVATKIATKIFKTGDLIEVDASKGVVRKI